MKKYHFNIRRKLFQTGSVFCVACLAVAAVSTPASAQTVVPIENFFQPANLQAKPEGDRGLLSLDIDFSQVTTSGSAGQVSWTHRAGGLVSTGTNLVIAGAFVELAAYTRTTGNSLVFGQGLSVETTGLLSALEGVLGGLITNVVSASVISTWESTALVSGLNLQQGQQYQVSFDVTSGTGLDLGLLEGADFALVDLNGNNLLGEDSTWSLLTLSLGTSTQTATFTFTAPNNISELGFNFSAGTGLSASLFGATQGQNSVLSFSNFSVAPVPEPSGVAMAGLAALGMLSVRRRRPAAV